YDTNKGIGPFLYPEFKGEVKLTYPLWDQGIKAAIRDAGVSIKQSKLKEETLRKEIRDELQNRKSAIESGYIVLQKAMKTREESERFYDGLIVRFRQGRFTALARKNALDGVVQSELGVVQAKINFNINLLRYDLAKNYIFEKFGVDVEKEISRIQ
ncbi:MAG: TolC family protein, partial [Leptospira sp.]|nr:TolC family protein [Leptospira sp.]